MRYLFTCLEFEICTVPVKWYRDPLYVTVFFNWFNRRFISLDISYHAYGAIIIGKWEAAVIL